MPCRDVTMLTSVESRHPVGAARALQLDVKAVKFARLTQRGNGPYS